MLIVSRRVSETLMIGDEITVTPLGIQGNLVRLGVNVPADLRVAKEEIYEKELREHGRVKGSEIYGRVKELLSLGFTQDDISSRLQDWIEETLYDLED